MADKSWAKRMLAKAAKAAARDAAEGGDERARNDARAGLGGPDGADGVAVPDGAAVPVPAAGAPGTTAPAHTAGGQDAVRGQDAAVPDPAAPTAVPPAPWPPTADPTPGPPTTDPPPMPPATDPPPLPPTTADPVWPPAAASPWPPGAAGLLADLLGRFPALARPAARTDLLERMDAAAAPYPEPGGAARFPLDVPYHDRARDHLAAIVRAVETRPDPVAALDALAKALREAYPDDRALAWVELTVCALNGVSPLPSGEAVELVRALYGVPELPGPERLVHHVPAGVRGTGGLTGRETLPQILLRLSDRRRAPGRGPRPEDGEPLLRFLHAVAHDRTLPGDRRRLDPLRDLLTALGPPPRRAAVGGRLIVQIRVEPVDAPHVADEQYQMWAAYYRLPAEDGPLEHVRSLEPTAPFPRSALADVGSARMTGWRELAREVRAAEGKVRVEFLLPATLLGHRAELWSAGPSQTPLGRHHPVVVRSLERYSDHWLDQGPWRRRWDHLCQDPPEYGDGNGEDGLAGRDGEAREAGAGGAGSTGGTGGDPLDRIAWPPLDEGPVPALIRWLAQRPELACLGLSEPYDRLTARNKAAVSDALFMEGVPAMVWRRDRGDPAELLDALRDHSPKRLRDLPETVHHCRRQGRTAGEADVRNNITLLWDDPYCVDADQDMPFAGMA
ncbi:hypothetical protein [Streptomyces sp. HPF1205]|uniref:VMAP-C domain-containing protein n=1 Tax=Streptomyces sp. HPF1205 TaxID=2873262 RepID=UPI001CEC3E34|nr:hypothetical protein [Streptomyces sp. HPF1205]